MARNIVYWDLLLSLDPRNGSVKSRVLCTQLNLRKNYQAFGFAIFFGSASADIDLRFTEIVSGKQSLL